MGKMLYFCSCKRGEIRLPKESAFSPYSDCVNLNNLRICKTRNKGVTKCSHWMIISCVELFRLPLYSFYREVQALTQEDRDIMDGSTFFVVVVETF